MRFHSRRPRTSAAIPISSARVCATPRPKAGSRPQSSVASRPETRKWTWPGCWATCPTTDRTPVYMVSALKEDTLLNRQPTEVTMANTPMVDMKLEVVVIPVSDVNRAKRFYGNLGWRLDADFTTADDFRVIQFTPPGSSCSIHIGTARTGVAPAAPGSAQGLYLIVSDIEAARAELVDRGVDVS